MKSYHFQSKIRNLVVGVDTKIPISNGNYVTAINFDNAATTPPLNSVLNDVINFCPWYSSIHRGTGYKSIYSSNIYENSRKIIKKFVNAKESDSVVYVKNTTEAINRLSYILCNNEEDIVLSTYMEHHSNDLPWRNKYNVKYINTNKNGKLDIEDLENKLSEYKNKVKLVTVTGASNVTGYINPIYKIAKIVHKYNSKLLVDGAQLVPHHTVNMNLKDKNECIDYLVFSAHKMYAPFGIGVLICPRKCLDDSTNDHVGGGTVKLVTDDTVIWDSPPHKNEAGSPNIIGVVSLVSAIKSLNSIGMDVIDKYENDLVKYAINKLKQIPDVTIYLSNYEEKRIATIPFNINGIHHEVIAKALSFEEGISVRSGCFCAHPYILRLLDISDEEMRYHIDNPDSKRPGLVRISFGFYNTFYEVDRLINMIKKISNNKDFYMKKYNRSYDNLNKKSNF